jgi:hypothetical protein
MCSFSVKMPCFQFNGFPMRPTTFRLLIFIYISMIPSLPNTVSPVVNGEYSFTPMHSYSLTPCFPSAYSQALALHSPCVSPRSPADRCSHGAYRGIRLDSPPATAVLACPPQCLRSSAIPERTRCALPLGSPPRTANAQTRTIRFIRERRTLARRNLAWHRRTRAQKAISGDFLRRCESEQGANDRSLTPAFAMRPAASHGVIAGNRLCVGSGIEGAERRRDWPGKV